MYSLRLRHTSSVLTAMLIDAAQCDLQTVVGILHPAADPAHAITLTLPSDDRRLRLCRLHELGAELLTTMLQQLLPDPHDDTAIPSDLRLTVTATHPPLHHRSLSPIRDTDHVTITLGYTATA
ncbi:hypothetical protein AB2L57_10760 [Microbacterium sp. HA-8]|uniref:hypothetical protein n=1 Tax=Microbacterium sp. HA-8 TaxID=3234200 RepID=UPI0038F7A0E0